MNIDQLLFLTLPEMLHNKIKVVAFQTVHSAQNNVIDFDGLLKTKVEKIELYDSYSGGWCSFLIKDIVFEQSLRWKHNGIADFRFGNTDETILDYFIIRHKSNKFFIIDKKEFDKAEPYLNFTFKEEREFE